jgi:uncharacterized protein YkwD
MNRENNMLGSSQTCRSTRTSFVRGATLAVAAIGLTAGSVVLAAPSSAAPLDPNAAVGAMNAARNKVGCPSLALNSALTNAAEAHSGDMARTSRAASTGSGKSTPASRIKDAGYEASSVGEIVLMTPPAATSADVVNAFVNSENKSILNCKFTDVGIGVVSGSNSNSYWTIDFARPA